MSEQGTVIVLTPEMEKTLELFVHSQFTVPYSEKLKAMEGSLSEEERRNMFLRIGAGYHEAFDNAVESGQNLARFPYTDSVYEDLDDFDRTSLLELKAFIDRYRELKPVQELLSVSTPLHVMRILFEIRKYIVSYFASAFHPDEHDDNYGDDEQWYFRHYRNYVPL